MTRPAEATKPMGTGDAPTREAKDTRYCTAYERSFLEEALPFRELSLLAQADRRSRDPVYAVHRWWARRPPSAMRGLLLAAALPHDTDQVAFWDAFRSSRRALEGTRVHDSFIGGGTVLVEAARLGADVSGTDTDPLAVEIVRQELLKCDEGALKEASSRLIQYLRGRGGTLFAGKAKGWEPLHYFYLRQVACPACRKSSLVYRNPVIARDTGKVGAVVRDAKVVAFCPECLRVHGLAADRKQVRCCGRWPLGLGTFEGHRFKCRHCGAKASHEQLKTGIAERVLVAVEETHAKLPRRIRQATARDRECLAQAARQFVVEEYELRLPTGRFPVNRRDSRPVSFGITDYTHAFTDRQKLVFGHAFAWASQLADADTRRSLELALSNALTTNNVLCGYATEYGRLAPLFSVRSYALPALGVELNPLHEGAGRGTLIGALQKLEKSLGSTVRRHVWSPVRRSIEVLETTYDHRKAEAEVRCDTALALPRARDAKCTFAIFDPPYFDFISYSELSEFYRAWLRKPRLGGVPLLPSKESPESSFSKMLTAALRSIEKRLEPGRLAAFTFHATAPEAWRAIANALTGAEFRVTALWPLMNDAHMGHHSHEGNCEWDMVVVCRRKSETQPAPCAVTVDGWTELLGGKLVMRDADQRALECAVQSLAPLYGCARGEH